MAEAGRVIRLAGKKDWGPLCVLYDQILGKENGRWTPLTMEDVCKTGLGLLAEEEHTKDLLGFILLQVVEDESEILAFGVTEEKQGQGIGKDLLTASQKLLKERNIKRLFLEVSDERTVAQNLYKRVGFETIGLRKKYYKCIDNKFFDAIVMLCNL
jgi:ribosomal-protein-alanine acetyltransferase